MPAGSDGAMVSTCMLASFALAHAGLVLGLEHPLLEEPLPD